MGTLRGNLQPGIPCELNEREFCAGINCKTNTGDIFQEQEILSVPAGTRAGNTICPSRNNINDRCIFGQDDKTKDDIDKKSNKDPHNLIAIPMHLN